MPRYADIDTVRDALYEADAITMKGVRILNQFPTLSPDEVRGVVHCKDCKWCHAGYCEKYDDLIPFGCANKPWEDWFCADGEMKGAEDGTTD